MRRLFPTRRARPWRGRSVPVLATPVQSVVALAGVLAGALAVLTAVVPASGAAPSSWVALPAQSPSGLAANQLAGVSCWGAGGCFAAGGSATLPGQPDLLESLGAGGWAVPGAPPGPGTYRNQLDALSCTSASFCVAVGYYQDYAQPAEPLFETYADGSWSVLAGKGPGAGGNYLTGVSCPAIGSCVAVGYYSNLRTDQALAETLNNGNWSLTNAADLGPGGTRLEAVSCSSLGNCWAVGSYEDSAGTQQALAEYQMSNGSWALGQAAENGTSSNSLAALSCPAPSSCVAVGQYYNGHAVQTLAESLSGTTWSVVASPNASVANNGLLGVSCPAPGSCVAVGAYSNGRAEQTLAMSLSGGAWHLETSPDQAGASNALAAVSCPSSGECEAVGYYTVAGTDMALGMALSGTTWALVPTQGQQAPADTLAGVSCPSPGSCVAVGAANGPAGLPQVLAEVLNGTNWALSQPALPPGVVASYLNGVSCPVPANCEAVGYGLSANGTAQAVAETYSSGSWALTALPLPSAAGTYLSAVSCPALGSCVAVGYDLGAGGKPQLLVETYSAGTWALSGAPAPQGSQASQLAGISCPAVGTCVAVGSYTSGGTQRSLVEALSNGSWSVAASANQGNGANALQAVSCQAGTGCAAVGYYAVSGSDRALTESVPAPGAAATLVSSASPAVSYLSGVSCPAAGTCAAVGYRTNGLARQSFVEVLSGGSWAVAPSYDTSDEAQNSLTGLSCTSDLSCVAVGSYQDGSAELALAESGRLTATATIPLTTTTAAPRAITTSTTQRRRPKTAATATLLSSVPNPSVAGHRVTYSAVVRPVPGGGQVTFTDDGVGISACRAVPVNGRGTASCSVVYASPGDHVIEALFSGAPEFGSSASGPFSQLVVMPPPLAQGYWLATRRGAVFAAGAARKLLGLSTVPTNPVVSIAAAPDGNGYWVAAANGKVGAFGSSRFYGDLRRLKEHVDDIVSITPTPDGRGYWLVGRDGGLFAFGDASWHGSLVSRHVRQNDIVGMFAAPRARGYALVSATGAVFTFGDARFHGSLPGERVHVRDIRAVVAFPGGSYMLVGAGGGVFTFGRGAHFYGSLPGEHVRVSDIVGAALTPDAHGYLMAGSNGSVYGFGDAIARPLPPGLASHLPVVGIAGR
jgi:hypothetical protein